MAYVPDLEENKQNTAATPQIGTSAALPTTGGGGAAGPNSGMTPAQPASQGFANLNQYLQANQGQGQPTANTIASNLGNQYTGLQGDITNAANQATEAIQGGSTAYNPELVSSALQNPSQFVANPENLAAWQKQYNAAYTGPTAFENASGYGTAATAANKAAQTYQLGQTGSGYKQLLAQIEKNPTAGKTALDQALIQTDPNAGQTVQTAINPFKGIQDYLSGKSTEIGKQASEAAKTTGETATKTKEEAAGAETNFANDITNKLTQKNKEYQDTNDLYQNLYSLPDYQLNPDYRKNTGLSFNDAADLWRQENILQQGYGQQFSPSDYLQFTPGNAPTKENISSPEDIARSTALSQLTGRSPFVTPNTSGSAYKAPAISYNTPAAKAALTERVNQQDQQLLQTADKASGYDILADPSIAGRNPDGTQDPGRAQDFLNAVSNVLIHNSFDRQFWPYDSGEKLDQQGFDKFKKYADAAIRQGKLALDPNTYEPLNQTDAFTPPQYPNEPPGTIGFGGGTPGVY